MRPWYLFFIFLLFWNSPLLAQSSEDEDVDEIIDSIVEEISDSIEDETEFTDEFSSSDSEFEDDYASDEESGFESETWEDSDGWEEDSPVESTADFVEDQREPGLVEREYLVIKSSENISDTIRPYRQRRQRWSSLFSFGYSFYSPENYQPDFQPTSSFDGIYASSGMLEAKFVRKLNFTGGALGLGLAAGYYKADSNSDAPAESTLTVFPLRAEAMAILDALFSEPWVAPYGLVGVYTNFYSEEQTGNSTEDSSSVSGNTAIGTYFGIGLNLQLDWIEPERSVLSYINHGIENTYIYIEAKKYVTSSSESDPDFETGFQLAAGAKFEY